MVVTMVEDTEAAGITRDTSLAHMYFRASIFRI